VAARRKRLPQRVGQPARRLLLAGSQGSQLFEFALVLPLLLVIVIGISDFGGAFNLKQKLNNAAREGARFGASESTLDLTGSTQPPPSIVAVRDVVQNYLTGANLTQCAIGTTPTKSVLTWTYTSSSAGCSSFSLVIDRGFSFLNGTTTVFATRVTLTYPYTWTFGRIIGLLVQGASPTLPASITSDAVMQNLS
jgi:Flp pilus assembly protein TadG